MRVLLLNPPGQRTYIRDYFCSKTTKSNYLFHPIDLVMLSGTLASEHDVQVLDCIAERLSVESARTRIDEFAPEVIVSLVGSVSWDEDRVFLAEQATRKRRIFAIGDVLQENVQQRLTEESWMEACLHDFSSDDVLRYLVDPARPVPTMSLRGKERSPVERSQRSYEVPRPRHELFSTTGYSFSFARQMKFATVLTDYGCPFPCTFCVIGTLGFKTRSLGGVLEEIDELRARGIREVFFMDQTFGVKRDRALELCRELASRGDLSWTGFTRPDTCDDELLSAMKAAGCHTLIIGVESASDETLREYKKGYGSEAVTEGVARVRKHGIRTVGTFILGLPEETRDSLEATLQLAIELELDFMSINLAVPRFGTEFRAKALSLGLANDDDLVMDQGGADAFLPTKTLNRAAVLELKQRAVRRFYLRPSYLWRRFKAVRSWHELVSQVREGAALLRRNA